jgi:hypothetical protein
MRTAKRFAVRVCAVLALVSAACSLSLAQSRAETEMERARAAEMNRRAGEDARRLASWELKLLEQRKAAPRERDYNLTYAQIREDYRQLQLVNNELARATSAGAFDPKGVEKAVSEIRKRAARLKENLTLPEPDPKQLRPDPAGRTERMEHLLIILDNLVMAFVNNPIFEQGKVADVKMSMKARADLEGIIEVSDRITKGGKSKTAAQKSP